MTEGARGGGRTRVTPHYAILPPEGIPESVLPEWSGTSARILAAPAMGARFAEYLLDLAPEGGTEQSLPTHLEAFFYVLAGEMRLDLNGLGHRVGTGGYAYLAPGSRFAITASRPTRALWLKKRYEPWPGSAPHDLVGDVKDVPGVPFPGAEKTSLQTLLPADPAYDLAMNVFTFPPGTSLPVTETHVMEHGLYFLDGRGVYYLGQEWIEVGAGDFIWMGPYCPQSFYATGDVPSRYLYYKNVHRDVEL